jgi:hypothetical protein
LQDTRKLFDAKKSKISTDFTLLWAKGDAALGTRD